MGWACLSINGTSGSHRRAQIFFLSLGKQEPQQGQPARSKLQQKSH